MYYRNYNKFIEDLKKIDITNYMNYLAVWGGGEPFKELLIQRLIRDIDDKQHRTIEFLAIRNIEILPQCKGKGFFKDMFNILESKNIPLYLDDVVNDRLNEYLNSRGYRENITEKNGQKIISRYRVPNMPKPFLKHKMS